MDEIAAAGWLSEAHSTLAWDPEGILSRLLPGTLLAELSRRSFPSDVFPFLRLHPAREILRLLFSRSPLRRFSVLERFVGIEAVVRHLDRVCARAVRRNPSLRAVYCYEDLALETFRAAKERGLTTFYEVPTPAWRLKKHLLMEERVMQPEWLPTLMSFHENESALARKDEELRLADRIIVPSEFVRRSLDSGPAFDGTVHLFPYAVPEVEAGAALSGLPPPGRLRVLYTGNLGQAKGMSYLDEAFHKVESGVTLTLAGGKVGSAPCSALEKFLARHDYRGQVPNADLIRMLPEFDVLVMPTLFDGFSLSVLEAMSRGLTVITNANCGIAGILEDGRDGFIVPVRDGAAIATRLNQLRTDHALLARLKAAAHVTAQTCSIANYRSRLRECLADGLGIAA